MAFNFNWSPLSTDAGFLPRAQELLTNALNRADPKPAIIVDDIIVNELNLGDVPPELEILEIGDLAEDRFRGTFKMMYRGNAFLTLKTKVQANPLNTFLGTRSPFAAPQPLAADTGLTIPLQITLSEFRLSGFIILVFSRQKGLTLVFRNDPLESLRVSSTFDSIPFVANFLQKEIENQLRGLLMDELPAIIHRLSLRLWVPDHETREEREMNTTNQANDEVVIDPLASPPQDPVDSTGAVLTPSEIAALSLDSSLETQSLFSQKNLIRLATLTDSNRTLSLFTPTIREAVFRACTGPLERGEMTGLHSRSATPALSRTHSYAASLSAATTSTFDTSPQSRPGLSSFQSASHGLSMGGSRHGQGHRPRKRKKRVVNLRRQPETGEMELISEDGSTADTASVADSTSAPRSVLSAPAATTASDPTRSPNPVTPPQSPAGTRHNLSLNDDHMRGARSVSQHGTASTPLVEEAAVDIHKTPRAFQRDATIRVRSRKPPAMTLDDDPTPRGSMLLPEHTESSGQMASQSATGSCDKSPIESEGEGGSSRAPIPNFFQFVTDPSNGSSIAERAWMMKMASEMAKRYEEERSKGSFGPFSPSADERHPPPAYAR